MLAKLWKKVLLAICIIACLFDVTYKIVNRHSLKVNLESVNDGVTVFDFKAQDTEKNTFQNTDNQNKIENSITNEDSKHYIVYDENGNIVDEYETPIEEIPENEVEKEETEENKDTQKGNKGVQYKDVFTLFEENRKNT